VELSKAAGVKALAIFHLYPGHDDHFLKAAEAAMQAVMPTAFMARERQSLVFEPADDETVADRAQAAKVPAV
jgi:hypothetical protein